MKCCDWFNDPFAADCDSPFLNLPPINIGDIPLPHKRAHYIPYLLPDTIYVASEKSVSSLNTSSDSPTLLLVPSDDHNPHHNMNTGDTYHGRVKIGYLSRKHDEKYATKRRGYTSARALINTRNVFTVMGFTVLIQIWGLASWNINILWNKDSFDWCVCLVSILYFTCQNSFSAYFITVPLITTYSNPHVWSAWNFDLVFFLLNVLMHMMTGLSDR